MKIPHWRDRGVRLYGQCESKKSYDSPQTANKAIKVMKRCARSLDGPVHSYRCGFCKKWHVGSVSKKPRAPRKKERRQAGLA